MKLYCNVYPVIFYLDNFYRVCGITYGNNNYISISYNSKYY